MVFKDKIFREYDIRGTVDEDFDADFARALGRAYAEAVKSEYPNADPNSLRVGIGRDCRVSGESLSAALIDGLLAGGVSVLSGGMGPTPQLYYMVFAEDLSGGIQVTGSHNPADQNGFKMMIGKRTLSGADIQALKVVVEALPQDVGQRGELTEMDARSEYIVDLVERSKPHMNPARTLRVVVDGGNGVGGMVGPEVLRQLGCEVTELYTEPDGTFPNHHPDPTVLENIAELRKRVVDDGADLGIAWDGDADRIGVVDERGEPIYGDMLLLLYGRQLLKEVENPTIIGDVKCSEILFRDLEQRGANAVMAKTGHSLIKAKLKELNAELAGEMSGHIFFNHRFYGFDDALHAAARLAEIMSNTDGAISGLLSDIPKMVSTPEIRVDCPDEVKFSVAEKAKDLFPDYATNDLDGVRITFDHGWGLVRASNTQPVLVMRFEAENDEQLASYRTLVEERISELRSQLANT